MAFGPGGLVATLTLVSVAALGPVTATADPAPPPPPPAANPPSGTGSVGSANAVVNGRQITIAPLGTCDTDGKPVGFTAGARANLVEVGWGTSVCRKDAQGNVTVDVSGAAFATNVLRLFGGPPIRIGHYSVSCSANRSGTRATMQVDSLLGAWLPTHIPPNYTLVIRVPGPPGARPLARIVLNEQTYSPGPNRSLTVNAVRVQLFPPGSTAAPGEFVAGTVRCSPGVR